MTRINCVPVTELVDKHLVAEYRELPRIYKLARACRERGVNPGTLPATYRLGKGHVLFFYNRLGFIKKRHGELIREMLRRGFQVNFPTPPTISDLPNSWRHDWQPTDEAMELNRARIAERLGAS